MRVLVGVDGSQESSRAVAAAARYAAAMGRDLTLALVAEPLHLPNGGDGLRTELEAGQRREGQAVLDRLAMGLPNLKIETRFVESGSPAVMLAELAAEEDVDFVVIGSRGRGAIARALLGSTSDRLAHICPKPVLVVR